MARPRRWTTRRFAVIITLLALLAACGQTQPTVPDAPAAPVAEPSQTALPGAPKELPLSGPVAEAPGKLLFDGTGSWVTLELSTQQRAEIATFPEQTFPSTPAVAPDGQTVAFSLFTYGKGPEDPAYGTDLYLMQPDGSQQERLLAHTQPAETLTDPAWSPDGNTLYFTLRPPTGEPQIERVRRDGSERSVVIKQGHSPTLSADGQQLVYIGRDPQSKKLALMIAQSDGSNPRPLLPDQDFQVVAAPRFAPKGSQIVFAAAPNSAQPSSTAGPQHGSGFFDWLRPRVARAHGVPWDLWVVNPDGSGLQQLTHLEEDGPVPAWSPDGAWIGFKGEIGLYIVDAAGKQVRRVAEDVAASIAWLP